MVGSRGSVIPFFLKQRETGKLPITDPRMSRFWITLQEGAAFVDKCLGLMRGGEIFIPKIPSMKIVDLASAIGPDCEQEIIGIRPGEKLHEIMIPRDEARHTLEFDDYYLIYPEGAYWGYDSAQAYGGEVGRSVAEDFDYSSDNNTDWVDAEQLSKIIEL